ncbi:CBM35 domain-containing protein, partial [Streptomyces sp. B21-106]|uniref:CBM35 domain-containing protein n=1 Tax=Streptomyces sp. B21-106 TaxID=3039418 RepID=UPI002FF0D604
AAVARDGSVTVPLTGLDAMSAYRITVNPAGGGTPAAASLPWSATYEAENAAITGGTVYSQGSRSNPYGFATSGTKDVGSLNQATSKVAFTVDVPRTGTYDLDVFYGNQSGGPATQSLTVDGDSAGTLTYGSTLNWTYRAKASTPVTLTAGKHTLTLAKGTNEVTLDKIDLTASTTPGSVYPATYADISGSPPTTIPPRASAAPAPWYWTAATRPPSTSTRLPTATTPCTPTTPPPATAP